MRGTKRGLSLGSVLTIVLTVGVLVGCILFFCAFQSGENVVMTAQKMAGMIGGREKEAEESVGSPSQVRTVTVTLAPTLPTPVPEPEGKHYTAALTLGGMLAFQSEISDAIYDKTTQVCDYQSVLSALAPAVHADLNAVVLQQALTANGKGYSDTAAQSGLAGALRLSGFDTVLLHTGKALEAGLQAVNDTAKVLSGVGMNAIGVQADGAVPEATINRNGIRIAILSFAESISKKAQSGGGSAIRLYSDEAARDAISNARASGADCVIVYMHWGNENAKEISSAQRAVAQRLTGYGADLILGTGPTRVLPVEKVIAPGENGSNRQAIAAYSLGKLLTESREGYDISGMLLHVTLDSDGSGRSTVSELSYTPTYIWRQNIGGKYQYRIVNSREAPPEGMNQNQIEVMGRALERVRDTLGDNDFIHMR